MGQASCTSLNFSTHSTNLGQKSLEAVMLAAFQLKGHIKIVGSCPSTGVKKAPCLLLQRGATLGTTATGAACGLRTSLRCWSSSRSGCEPWWRERLYKTGRPNETPSTRLIWHWSRPGFSMAIICYSSSRSCRHRCPDHESTQAVGGVESRWTQRNLSSP